MKGCSLTTADIRLYGICEELTRALICFMVLFSPWAFGSTEPWSVWTMNGCAYVLGLLLAAKIALRTLKAYKPPRWNEPRRPSSGARFFTGLALQRTLAIFTAGILSYCMVSALNARSTYHPAELSFTYHPHLRWLPSSLDSGSSWFALWTCLGFACSFWAVWDWLLGKSGREQALRSPAALRESQEIPPARLRTLLWLLAINGAVLGLEALAQRLAGSGKLLFLVKPRFNPEAITQFGPYAYRANAAQYFNLLWPVCLGFWWTLRRVRKSSRRSQYLPLICAIIMAACPLTSTSRGGALITIGLLFAATLFLFLQYCFPAIHLHERPTQDARSFFLILAFALAVPTIGCALGWKTLKPRLLELPHDIQYRAQMYANATPMASDYPVFGTGPGTFENAFQFYRGSTYTYWPAQLHNDWLETRITFGWAGTFLLASALLTVALRTFAPGGIPAAGSFVFFIWLALTGALLHACFDFPFQIHSIVFLFLLLCSILFTLSKE